MVGWVRVPVNCRQSAGNLEHFICNFTNLQMCWCLWRRISRSNQLQETPLFHLVMKDFKSSRTNKNSSSRSLPAMKDKSTKSWNTCNLPAGTFETYKHDHFSSWFWLHGWMDYHFRFLVAPCHYKERLYMSLCDVIRPVVIHHYTILSTPKLFHPNIFLPNFFYPVSNRLVHLPTGSIPSCGWSKAQPNATKHSSLLGFQSNVGFLQFAHNQQEGITYTPESQRKLWRKRYQLCKLPE